MSDIASKPLAVAIMGPTASGKTASALAIAARIPSEIISVDSALVYRGMDIGTAKPTRAELAAVPHHLIDIIDPLDSYSVAQFRKATLQLVDDIVARGKLPLLVGGTMLYFKGLADGLDDLPGADPALRAQLEDDAARIGWPAMHARLATLDPETAARLAPADAQRIQRALEICALAGKPMSELLALRDKTELPFELLPLALEPSDRAVLHKRIERRFDIMLDEAADDNLITETERLRRRGDLHPGLPSMRCVGYRQAWEYLDGTIDYKTMRETGIIATRQLAKRQLTWLRSMPDRVVVDCLGTDPAAEILAHVADRLG
ncbi:tRNA (adenosine(37)-N6)-dimethylallyltransferase MiaA [Duganella sp. FT27W]|uniref:tRNA (adenosine(37)-N6)-dimethylallyltransferase MiaA n=1 Tax=Duganella sp. FT27W TaxID=2654636 RepID=UPI00128B25A8|nr:tRNA (adenosine(37)-N6)-dimethylallyltransferase MiaA [Duganella sp. FT27W]MPQ57329.1 tRNA (adenosine(37)-N6)-dimethylallyltransferase MiaA [Duganella sp. FT27W]